MSDREERRARRVEQKNRLEQDAEHMASVENQQLDGDARLMEGADRANTILQDQMNTFGIQIEAMQKNMLAMMKTVSDLKEQVSTAPSPGTDSSRAPDGATPTESATSRSSTEAVPVSAHRIKPQEFDGKVSWPAYRAQFELIAAKNGWVDEKAAYLAGSLKGPTLELLGHLPAETQSNYSSLATALEQRFGTANQDQLFRTQLRSRT